MDDCAAGLVGGSADAGASGRRGGLALPVLTVGFATAVVMWIVGYVTHFPGLGTPAWVVAGLFAVVQLGGGVLAWRLAGDRRVVVGAGGGLVASLINLLIVGSIIGSADDPNALREGWVGMVVGTLVFGVLLGGAGAWVAGVVRERRGGEAGGESGGARVWLARFAVVAALSGVPVLLSGGLVTSTASGLAVPDWPASYDAMMFLFPLQDMTGGIYYEHAHRLFGSLVGLTVLVFMVCVLVWEPRRSVKAMAVAAFALVVVQGVLGGVRVTAAVDEKPREVVVGADGMGVERWSLPDEGVPHNYAAARDHEGSVALAMVHGISGQLTFALLCVVACAAAVRWARLDVAGDVGGDGVRDRWLRGLSFVLLGALVVQLTLGAGLRHFGHVGFLHTHIAMSVVVVCVAAFAGLRSASRRGAGFGAIPVLGKAIVGLVLVQFALGWATLFLVMPYDGSEDSVGAIAMATVHQATGAALLGCAAMLAAWSWRLLGRGGAAAGSDAGAVGGAMGAAV
ncbi:MAG: COX15/CtaA family protein [Phycisphaerales bacterium]